MNLENTVESEASIQLWTTLGRMEAKLDTVVDMEKRVKSLEIWRALLVGAWGLLTVLIATAFSLLGIIG